MSTHYDRRQALKLAGALVGSTLGAGALRGREREPKGLVIAPPEAAKAGMEILAAGGNAVDAAVAAALVAGVVAVPMCGIGGYGGHMTIASADGKKISSIDFNSAAPAAARADMFRPNDKGEVPGRVNEYGWLASGVPGTLAGMQLALDRHGTRTFDKVVAPAIKMARDGFEVTRVIANSLSAGRARFMKDPASARLFFDQGEPLKAGATLRNPDLAKMLETLAERKSADSFYRGDIARKIADEFKKNGGLVTATDLASYHAVELPPLSFTWRGFTIHTAPLTAGGLTILQALATLKALGWESRKADDPATAHALLEALRIAWDDRLKFLGDPNQVKVPVDRLLSEAYARQSAERVDQAVRKKEMVPAATDGRSANGTIHLNAVDGQGMMVALTLTHGNSYGAQVMVDGLGLLLGHGMSRFDPQPGHANSPGPGKRPLHNMCPTIVVREGRPIVALGAAGGRKIPNTVFQVLAQLVGRGQSLDQAVAAPRLHTEGGKSLELESRWPEAGSDYFKKLGYTVKTSGGASLRAIGQDDAREPHAAAR